jgi:superkiller protein 3
LHAAILAHKRAIYAATEDLHARAVAWYNWVGRYARMSIFAKSSNGSEEALEIFESCYAMFQASNRIEAGNSDFWDSLGVVTTQLSPKVSQHAFTKLIP